MRKLKILVELTHEDSDEIHLHGMTNAEITLEDPNLNILFDAIFKSCHDQLLFDINREITGNK